MKLEELAVEHGAPLADAGLPRVAVVIPNLSGWHHLEQSLPPLIASDYPPDKFEIIVVDNASTDGSLASLARLYPQVRVVVNDHNTGFAVASNQGAAAAKDADVAVFLNNDVRVEPAFLRELVSPIMRGECQSSVAKMMSWDGKVLDNGGGGSNLQGIAIAHGYKEVPTEEHNFPRKCLFACGGAMAMDAKVFADVGGFDEEFFAYYEDLDLGWRLWVMGHEVHYVPSAVCYHHHSGTTRLFAREMVRVLEARNPLFTCIKNYDDENFAKVFPALLALAVRRMWVMSRPGDLSAFRIEQAGGKGKGPLRRVMDWLRRGKYGKWSIERQGMADFVALNDFLGNWDHWMKRRAEIQSRRKRADSEIFRLFLKPHWCVEGEEEYMELQHGLTKHFGIDELFDGCSVQGPEPHK